MDKASLLKDSPSVGFIWICAALFAGFFVLATFTPVDVLARYPMADCWTKVVQGAVPMIERVTAYAYPEKDKLRFLLAIGWSLVPIMILALGTQATVSSRKEWGTTPADLFGAQANAVVIYVALFLFFWFWPDITFPVHSLLGPIHTTYDGRRWMFSGLLAACLAIPIIVFASALALHLILVEIRLSLRRIGEMRGRIVD